MSNSTLAAIKKKVRRLTASPSVNQLSESDLEDYIDTFYEIDLPSHLKTWNLHDKMVFYTKPNEDEYAFDTSLYHAVVPPIYIDGYQCFYSNSREEFFRIYPKVTTEQTGSTGDGTTGPYTFTLNSLPVLKRHVTLSVIDTNDDTLTVYDVPSALDNNEGALVDSSDNTTERGTINYVTGAISVTWSNTIPATESIDARFVSYQASRPSAVLFFKDYFVLRPIPDKAYRVEVEVYQKPSQLLSSDDHSGSNAPDVNQWWQYIAFGAAIKILQDRQDMESIQNLMPFFKEQENLILYRTATQQAPERTSTIYTQQLKYPVGGNFGGGSGL